MHKSVLSSFQLFILFLELIELGIKFILMFPPTLIPWRRQTNETQINGDDSINACVS